MELIEIIIYIAIWGFGVYCGYGARPQIESGVMLMKSIKQMNKLEEQKDLETVELPNSLSASNSLPLPAPWIEDAAKKEYPVGDIETQKKRKQAVDNPMGFHGNRVVKLKE